MRRVVVLLVALGCGGPLVTIPGGELSGPVAEVPGDWGFTDAHETIQLETRPEDPYSVNIWGVGVGDRFMIASAEAENRWAGHMLEDPRVRLRIDGTVYELTATRSDDPADREAFLAAVKRKYDWEPEGDQASQAVLFVLAPR